MKFCARCGSYMEKTARGLLCPKCGNEVQTDVIDVRRARGPPPEPVYVVEDSGDEGLKVKRTCPRCGNHEAFRIVFSTQGEHAGVKQDRTVEQFKCTRCFHSWTRS